MYFATISNEGDREQKMSEHEHSMEDWSSFSADMQNLYGIDMSPLTPAYKVEQSDYYIYSGLWTELRPEHVVGQPVVVKHLDLNTCTMADSLGVSRVPYSVSIPFPTRVSGFAGWFTVDFAGSAGSPAQKRIILSTGPEAGYTHWGQQVFYLKDAVDCTPETTIKGFMELVRQDKNKRLYNLLLDVAVDDGKSQHFKYEIL